MSFLFASSKPTRVILLVALLLALLICLIPPWQPGEGGQRGGHPLYEQFGYAPIWTSGDGDPINLGVLLVELLALAAGTALAIALVPSAQKFGRQLWAKRPSKP